MNHKSITISMAAIVAVIAVTAVGFAVPQQALAHYGHHHHNNDNGIKVNQNISQLNACSNLATCINDATNNADVHR